MDQVDKKNEITEKNDDSTSQQETQVLQKDTTNQSMLKKVFTAKLPVDFNTRKINQYAILGLLIIVSFAIAPIVKLFFVPVIVAASFATLFYPLYKLFLKFFPKHRAIASFLTTALLFLLLVVPLYIVLHLFVIQTVDIFHSAGPFLYMLFDKIDDNFILNQLKKFPLMAHFDFQSIDWSQILNESVKTIASSSSRILNQTSSGILGLTVNIFVLFFTMFYFFMDGKDIVKRIKYLSPIRNDYEDLILSRFLLISRATVSGTLIVGLLQGSLGALSLLIFGIKSWLLWGFIMIVLSIIPVVGPWVVLIPAAIIQLFLGNLWQGIGILLFCIIVVSNVDNILRPRLVGQGAKLHDLVIFFSSLGGIAIFGIMGFIVGPVIASLFVSVLDIYSTEFEDQLKVMNET
jgi:predicted PurR-regulated permease PerM